MFVFDVAENDEVRLQDFYNNLQTLAALEYVDSTITRSTNGRRVRVELDFKYQEEFWDFNNMNHEAAQHTVDISRGVLFIERTRTIPNPWSAILADGNNGGTRAIKDEFERIFGVSNIESEITYLFVSAHRRTTTNADEIERHGLAWFYIFGDLEEDIVLFDRFANTPIWYVIGVGATVIFMAGLWFVLRGRARNNALQT